MIYIYIYIYIFFLHFYACFLYCWKPSVYPQPIFSQSYISIPPEISEKRKEHINATLTTARNIANVKKIYWSVFVTGKFFFFFFFEVVQNPVQEVINHTDECFDWTYYFVLLRQLQPNCLIWNVILRPWKNGLVPSMALSPHWLSVPHQTETKVLSVIVKVKTCFAYIAFVKIIYLTG